MAAAEVPTALARVCTTEAQVVDAIEAFGAPYVIKDDGLAAGKGVVVTSDREEALAHARACLAKEGGDPATHGEPAVVVEEFLDGPEISLFCLCDGTTVVPLAPGAGLQAAARRRRRPEHRRHGRLLPAHLGAGDPHRRGRRAGRRAGAPRDGPPGHAVRRPAVLRPRPDLPRPAGRRVQRPLRRPRDPGGPRPPRVLPRRGPPRRGHRPPRPGRRAAVEPGCRRDGRRRCPGLPRAGPQG